MSQEDLAYWEYRASLGFGPNAEPHPYDDLDDLIDELWEAELNYWYSATRL